MTYSELIPYAPAVLGVLLLVMYAFMRREVYKSLPVPEGAGKTTPEIKMQAYLRLSTIEPALVTATHRTWWSFIGTALAYAAAIGAWLPEATGWSGLFATWWWLLVALCLHSATLVLSGKVNALRAHAVGTLADEDAQAPSQLHLFGDGRWYAQQAATTKYALAALVCFIIAVGCALFFW